MNLIAVIPARMASTRFPGKPLAELCGKPMIQWVYEAAARAALPNGVVIATPDREIVEAARGFGAEAVLTRADHPTGTDRVAEAASELRADAYLNVQGDEPLLSADTIDACAAPIVGGRAELASVYDWAAPYEDDDPNVVKVVTDCDDRALYFSRSAIPYYREAAAAPRKKHVGIYAYAAETLRSYARWEPTPLEKAEVLEQLRFLENGVPMQMSRADASPFAVDTPEQAEHARQLLAKRGEE